MEKKDIIKMLEKDNIWYKIMEHEAVYNMEDISNIEVLYPQAEAKNLFVRDDKKNIYYLITVKGNKRIDLKAFRKKHNTRQLSFASERELIEIMKLTPGSVSPFGVLNDKNKIVHCYMDKDFFEDEGIIGVHPNENTSTIWLKVDDLIKIIKSNGNVVNFI